MPYLWVQTYKFAVNVDTMYKKINQNSDMLQGVSHNSPDAKTEAEFTWTPGADTAGPITFR